MFSDAYELLAIDNLFGSGTPDASHRIALFTTTPASDGTGGVEPTSNYARVTGYTNNATNWPNASTDIDGNANKSNGTAITFPTVAGSDWGVITGFGVYDAAGSTLVAWGDLDVTVSALIGDTPKFDIGSLVLLAAS